jgi:hypothetical protein
MKPNERRIHYFSARHFSAASFIIFLPVIFLLLIHHFSARYFSALLIGEVRRLVLNRLSAIRRCPQKHDAPRRSRKKSDRAWPLSETDSVLRVESDKN